MEREIIATDRAPSAVGPYSQAVKAGNLLFTAGQIGIDPATGQLVEGLDGQARQVLANLEAILVAAGSGLDRVIKTTIFLHDLAHFGRVNQIYGRAFPGQPPARSTVQVAALPLGALIEIEAVALCP
jgi:2-iminobutanoate/2-iminopropanoate deaminase